MVTRVRDALRAGGGMRTPPVRLVPEGVAVTVIP